MTHIKFPEDGEESKIVVRPGDIVDIVHKVDMYDSFTGEIVRTVKYTGRVHFDKIEGNSMTIRVFSSQEGGVQ